jgi:hypothetical protein
MIKNVAPISSETANEPDPTFNALNTVKTSGAPFPNANNVKPATLSLKLKALEIVYKLGHRKLDAVKPNAIKLISNINASNKMVQP